jgi:ppGpp synthetase/RelA/SpoT-type nucleotidyltranferase
MYPEKYNKEQYIAWHESNFADDSNLEKKIDDLRVKFKTELKEDLEFIAELLYYLIPSSQKEYKIHYETEFEYTIPLRNSLSDKAGKKYDLIFKSTDSIINKLWRKNKEESSVNLTNLKNELTDLVRTEITCTTLASCRFVSKRLELKNINLPNDYHLKEKLDAKIIAIEFEPEMKMASGYFAYHGLIKMKNGITIEVQVYSSLMANWRKLSHKLYEKIRLSPIEKHDFGTSESRLVSLGHLLHLAECEVERLESEIK